MVKCPVETCGKELANNSGLSSHMRTFHKLNRDGTPLVEVPGKAPAKVKPQQPEDFAVEQRHEHHVKAAKERKVRAVPRVNEPVKPSDALTRAQEQSARLAKKGTFRCPECTVIGKRITFSNSKELGKHRRFKHGVIGKSVTAQKRLLEAQAKAEAKVGEIATPSKFPCPKCDSVFDTQRALNTHVGHIHKEASKELTLISTQEIVNGSTQRKVNGREADGGGHSHNAALAQALAVSHVTGHVKSVILAAADEYDVPPRQLARRVLVALSEHYS